MELFVRRGPETGPEALFLSLMMKRADSLAGDVEFELPIEALQATEFRRVKAAKILRSGTFNQTSASVSGLSRAVFPGVGIKKFHCRNANQRMLANLARIGTREKFSDGTL
jgi:hypothetical protein